MHYNGVNFNKNKLINKTLLVNYETFRVTQETADFVPDKYNRYILRYIFKNLKKSFKRINKEDKLHQKELKKQYKQKYRQYKKEQKEIKKQYKKEHPSKLRLFFQKLKRKDFVVNNSENE